MAAQSIAENVQPQRKTAEEIETLKRSWRADPIWDVEQTEGFEAHYEELLAYRLQVQHERDAREDQRLADRADELGIPGNIALVQYLERLERTIDRLTERVEEGR